MEIPGRSRRLRGLRSLAARVRDKARDLAGRRGAPRQGAAGPGARSSGLSHGDLEQVLGSSLAGYEARHGRSGPRPDASAPLDRAGLRSAIRDFQRHALDQFAHFDPGPVGPSRVEITIGPETSQLTLPSEAIRPLHLGLENPGTESLGPFPLILNGEDLCSKKPLVELATAGATTEAGRAFAIYRFVRDRRIHGPPPLESRDDPRACDPVQFFNGIGYGLCGNAANNFAVLCHWAGLDSRVWNIRGHTLPEVSFEGRQRVLDPDVEAWYSLPPDSLPTSLSRLAKQASAVLEHTRVAPVWEPLREMLGARLSDSAAHLRAATGAELAQQIEKADGADFLVTLRPGERLELHYESSGPWISSGLPFPAPDSRPAELAHAKSHFSLLHEGALAHCNSSGLRLEGDRLMAEAGASCELEAGLAGPCLDAWLEVSPPEHAAAIELEVATPDGWQPTLAPTDFSEGRRSLRVAWLEDGRRRTRIRFASAVCLERLELCVLGQRARRGLPRFGPGPNQIEVPERVQVALEFMTEGPLSEPAPIWPDDEARLEIAELSRFAWSGPPGRATEIQVSATPDFEVTVASNLDGIVVGSEILLSDADRDRIEHGDLYWRVRRPGAAGRLPGPWSRTRRLEVAMTQVYVRNVARILDSGQPHWTLGTHHIDDGWFRNSGEVARAWLQQQGMRPDSRVVDFGCGSLRVGGPLIEALEPGCYVGLDVTDQFYRSGLEALDDDLVARKRPEFGLIDDAEIERQSASGCDLLFSLGVIMHVPEAELPLFMQRVDRLIGSRGVGLISYKQAAELEQLGPMTWAQPDSLLVETARANGLSAEVLLAKELEPDEERLRVLLVKRADA